MMTPKKILFFLFVVFVFSHVDRQLLAILLPQIKAEFALSDMQLGFLVGTTFAIFYAVFGLPAGWMADRFKRRNLILLSFSLWSAFTLFFGMAGSYFQLMAARISVAIGEAGAGPASQSIISDVFPENKRSQAMSIYASGINVGILCGFLIGGIVGQNIGWRNTFILMGGLGLLAALFLARVFPEPLRRGGGISEDGFYTDNFLYNLQFIWNEKALRYLVLGCSLANFVVISVTTWMPSFLVREHGFSIFHAGVYLALAIGVVGALGTYWGGGFIARVSRGKHARMFNVSAWLILVPLPFYWVCLLANDPFLSAIMFLIPVFLALCYMGPGFSAMQNLSPASSKGFNAGVMIFSINIVGLGLGPLISGAISDCFAQQGQGHGLRNAMLIITSFNLVSAYFYWLAAKHVGDR